MLIVLTVAVIILIIAVIGIILYLGWLPIKIKALIRENDEINQAMEDEEVNFDEEGDSNEQ